MIDPSSVSGLRGAGSRRPAHVAVPGYEILGELGHGRTATVHRARREIDGLPCALKVYRRRFAWPPRRLEDFRAVTRELGDADCPGICRTLDCGEDGGVTWIAMGLVEGSTLADRIIWARGRIAGGRSCDFLELDRIGRDAPRPPRIGVDRRARRKSLVRLLEFFEELARALAAGHARGRAHGDLRPANVIVTPEGRPVLLDWATLPEGGVAERPGRATFGDDRYTSPQGVTEGVDHDGEREDLWALGVMLHEAIALAPPHHAPTTRRLHDLVRTRPAPDLHRLDRATPRRVAGFVSRALALDPARRPADAVAFADGLAELRAEVERGRDARGLLDRLLGRF